MTQTYIKNPDGTFTAVQDNQLVSGAKQFFAAAANEASPATIHQAMQGLGAQIPAAIPLTGLAALASDPETINHIIAAISTGNPLAIAGTLAGVVITAYSTFTKTQIKGITDDQITTYVNSLSRDELLARLSGKSAAVIGDPASPTTASDGITGSGAS